MGQLYINQIDLMDLNYYYFALIFDQFYLKLLYSLLLNKYNARVKLNKHYNSHNF